ncbi:MAG: hypothetical protein U9O41_01050 [Candidatus Aerophobetes bacterium]|nr:hypothetical protein [Candidatus Aerophobetes bacterium]
MGRYDFSSREIVENCIKISIFRLIREIKKRIKETISKASKAEISKIMAEIIARGSLRFTQGDRFIQSFEIISTPTNLGIGIRYWFLCPKCRKRVAVLYMPFDGPSFLCRGCHNLTYRAQKKHDKRVDMLLNGMPQFSNLRHFKSSRRSDLLVFLKAWEKASEADFNRYFGADGNKDRNNEIEINIDLSSFGKKNKF